MSEAITDAWARLGGKVSVPSEMRTAEWARVPQWIRERSFWMAGVTRAEVLDEFRREAAAIVAGETSEEQSLKKLQQYLAATGYTPEPGQEGTIKDLRTSRRILTTLRTNRLLLQGWGQVERGTRPGPMRAFPGWELVRISARRVPRDWPDRFVLAGGRVLEDGRMIALKTDQVWEALGTEFEDSIGVHYPPFWWGSGSGLRGVPRREMMEMGLLDGWTPPPPMPVSSPNEALEMTPEITTPDVREALANHLQGLAEWKGETLVFTDPNGTRRYTGEELAEVWQRPMPESFQDLPGGGQMQREVFMDWAADSDRFVSDPAAGPYRLGRTDRWEDLRRVIARLAPNGAEMQPLTRTLSFSEESQWDDFVSAVNRDGYALGEDRPAEAWSSGGALELPLADNAWKVQLELRGGHSMGRDISALLRTFGEQIARRAAAANRPVSLGDIILPSWARFRVSKIHQARWTRMVLIELEEAV